MSFCHSATALAAIVLIPLVASTARAEADKVLFSFTQDQQGETPTTGVIADKTGALYGTTEYGGTNFESSLGTVFKLTPNKAKTAWTETVLYTFTGGASGGIPKGSLIMDEDGALYGTTFQGGDANCDEGLGCGTVYKLTPPTGTKKVWTEKTLHSFTGSFQGVGKGGIHPWGSLAFDKAGALYGTTQRAGNTGCLQGCGVVYKLTPNQAKTAWTETVLHVFNDNQFGMPKAGVVFDAKGALYGTAPGDGLVCCGMVYKLTPPAKPTGAWTEQTLLNFNGADGAYPEGGLALDKGVLFGTTAGDNSDNYGTVFMLAPIAGKTTYKATVLVTILGQGYAGPNGTPVLDAAGSVYFGTGSPAGGKEVRPAVSESLAGAIVKLVRPAKANADWKVDTLHAFQTTGDGAYPSGPLLLRDGVLYATTTEGWNSTGSVQTNGTVVQLAVP